jgi:putative endonuclease
MEHNYYVYIITNYTNTTLYIGVTNDLVKRIYQHKSEVVDGFSKKYKLNKLVYFEQSSDITNAIQREKQLKNWHRTWKINLIKQNNPEFKDLYNDIV